MAVLSIETLLIKFGSGKSPRSQDYLDLIDTLADDRNAVYFSATAPADTAANPLWFNTNTNVLSAYSAGSWRSGEGPQGPAGATGATGATGAAGATGETGPGVATGGTTGQYLVKTDGTNYNTQWLTLDLSGKQDVVANVSSTEIGYLDGVTSAIQTQLNDKAPLASPALTGTPTAPLATTGTNTTQIATTSFVQQELNILTTGAPAALNTLDELAAALGDDSNYAATITTALGLKAPLASPTFTGTPTLPTGTIATTQSAGNSTTAVATTAFVTTADNLKANIASPTFTGTVTIPTVADATTSTAAVGAGYMGVPPSAAATTGAYTIVAADAGEHIYSTATRTVTIPANASVAFPVGTAITFIAATGTTVTIAITTDTLLLAGAGTTGSRTLAPFGMATALKITSTSWIISGNGLT
jgi:hypothetical protein